MSIFGFELLLRFSRLPPPVVWSVRVQITDKAGAEEDCPDEATAREVRERWEKLGLQAVLLRNGRPLPEPQPAT